MKYFKILVLFASTVMAVSFLTMHDQYQHQQTNFGKSHQSHYVDHNALRKSWSYIEGTLKTMTSQKYQLKVNKTYKRLVIASEIDGGADFLAQYLQRHPGVYYITDPIKRTTTIPKVLSTPGDHFERLASKILVDTIGCEFDPWINNTNNWRENFCDSTFISQVCHLAPIKLLTVNLDQILALTLGKVLYDPWLSQNTKVIYVSRDPRGIIFDRDQNCAQHQMGTNNQCSNSNRYKGLCPRMRLNQLRIFQFLRFTPQRFIWVRYEDLLLAHPQTINSLLAFIGLENLPYMNQYLISRKPIRIDPYEAFPWMKGFTYSRISEIQKQCKKVMKYYGYRHFDSMEKMRLNPVMDEIPENNEDLLGTL